MELPDDANVLTRWGYMDNEGVQKRCGIYVKANNGEMSKAALTFYGNKE